MQPVMQECKIGMQVATSITLFLASWLSNSHSCAADLEGSDMLRAGWYYPQETTIIQTMANSVLDLNWGGGFHSFLVALSGPIMSNFEGNCITAVPSVSHHVSPEVGL